MIREALSEKRRKEIPKGEFVFKTKKRKGHKDKGKYPVDTKERARSALRLVGMHGTPAEKAKVRAAVKAKYGIGESQAMNRMSFRESMLMERVVPGGLGSGLRDVMAKTGRVVPRSLPKSKAPLSPYDYASHTPTFTMKRKKVNIGKVSTNAQGQLTPKAGGTSNEAVRRHYQAKDIKQIKSDLKQGAAATGRGKVSSAEDYYAEQKPSLWSRAKSWLGMESKRRMSRAKFLEAMYYGPPLNAATMSIKKAVKQLYGKRVGNNLNAPSYLSRKKPVDPSAKVSLSQPVKSMESLREGDAKINVKGKRFNFSQSTPISFRHHTKKDLLGHGNWTLGGGVTGGLIGGVLAHKYRVPNPYLTVARTAGVGSVIGHIIGNVRHPGKVYKGHLTTLIRGKHVK